jgi:hypothetical protein
LHAERTNRENTGHDILPIGGNIQNVERTADDSEKQSADDQARIYKSRFGPDLKAVSARRTAQRITIDMIILVFITIIG